MTLLLDSRIGSALLEPDLRAMGLAVEVVQLPYADVAFTGRGAAGQVSIGVERKTITEVVQALADARFLGHQLPGLLDAYDHIWLVVEGDWKVDRQGWLQTYPPAPRPRLAREVHGLLTTLQVRAGLRWWRTTSPRETAIVVGDLYRWWQRPWQEHRSHRALYTKAKSLFADVDEEYLSLNPKTRPQRVLAHAMQLPNVNIVLARRIAKRFSCPLEMATASEATWLEIEGIGKVKARAIRAHLGHGG